MAVANPHDSLVTLADADEPPPIGRALASAALSYADLGWPVFPLGPRSKAPLIRKEDGGRGCHDATTDPKQIGTWWAAHPWANIGLAAGPAFCVLDIDYGGWTATQADGGDMITALQASFGRLPATITSITGGGGWQMFWQPDERLRNGVKALHGLDTRASGGYVVAPPSIHPDSGRAYQWRRDHGPGEIEIARAPEWLIKLLEPVELPTACRAPEPVRPQAVQDHGHYARAALDRACAAITSAPIGCQCDTLEHQSYGIGRLVAGGVLPRDAAYAALVDAGGQMASDPRRRPWTTVEIEARVSRALRQAESKPRQPEERP